SGDTANCPVDKCTCDRDHGHYCNSDRDGVKQRMAAPDPLKRRLFTVIDAHDARPLLHQLFPCGVMTNHLRPASNCPLDASSLTWINRYRRVLEEFAVVYAFKQIRNELVIIATAWQCI